MEKALLIFLSLLKSHFLNSITGDGDTGTGSFFEWNNGTEMRTLKFNIIIIYNILYIIIILN